MGLGNGNAKSGNKASNHNYEHRHLLALGDISAALGGGAGLATEATLAAVLTAVQQNRDFELKLVKDNGAAGKIVCEKAQYNPTTGLYTYTYEDVGGAAYVPVGPLTYLDAEAVLNIISADILAIQGTDGVAHGAGQKGNRMLGTDGTLDQQVATDSSGHLQIDVLTSALPTGAATEATLAALLVAFGAEDFATETTLSALLTAFNAEDFATETTLGNVETLLTGQSRTPSATTVSTDGSTTGGVKGVGLWFRGSGGTLDGEAVPNGARFSFSADDNNDTVASIAYTVPTGGAGEIIITYLT